MSSEVKTYFKEQKENHIDISQALKNLRNKDASDYDVTSTEIADKIEPTIKNLWLKGISKKKKKWFFTEHGEELNKYASAEIESILKIQRTEDNFVDVYLIATDTVLSRLAASMIASFLNSNYSDVLKAHFNYKIDVIKNLKVDNFERFKNGLLKLSDRFYQIVDNKLRANLSQEIILNITGGYKGVIPYLSLLGQINQIQIQYTFENTGVLINIPQVPVKQDNELFEMHWESLHQLEEEKILNRYEYSQLFEELSVCFDLDGNDFCFNFLGEALWKKYKNQYFIFYAPDETWDEIQKQSDIKRILATKLWKEEVQKGSKNEQKGNKWCYDDGNNNNRIYNIIIDGKFIVYKSFEDEEAAKKYIDENIEFNKVIQISKRRKIKKQ